MNKEIREEFLNLLGKQREELTQLNTKAFKDSQIECTESGHYVPPVLSEHDETFRKEFYDSLEFMIENNSRWAKYINSWISTTIIVCEDKEYHDHTSVKADIFESDFEKVEDD